MTITLEIDDYEGIKAWRDQAKQHETEGRPFDAFMDAWIAFNTYVGQIAAKNSSALAHSCGRSKNFTESEQLDFLLGQPEFRQIFQRFVDERGNDCVEEIGLPVVNLQRRKKQPDSRDRTASLISLDCGQFFDVLRTIRHNLFHAGKSLDSLRDWDLCDKSSRVLIKFIDFLLPNAP